MRYFVVELSEKRPRHATDIPRDIAVSIIKKMADDLGVSTDEFTVTDVQQVTGVFYAVFYRQSYRDLFMLYMKGLNVWASLLDEVPPVAKFSPKFTTMPPLTKKGKEHIEGNKKFAAYSVFIEETRRMIDGLRRKK